MKISEIIKQLQMYQRKLGDVEVYSEDDDGRFTSAVKAEVSISFRELWRGHLAGQKHFIRF